MTNIIKLLNNLWNSGFVHGDLKAANIMIDTKDKLILALFIDLDQMKKANKKNIYKDKKRFLKNFIGTSYYQEVKQNLL